MSDYGFFTLSSIFSNNSESLIGELRKNTTSQIHTFYRSIKNKSRFYILSSWGSKEKFEAFKREPVEDGSMNSFFKLIVNDPFSNQFELNKIFDFHGNEESSYYKLSKSSVDSQAEFLRKYELKHTEEYHKSRKSKSIVLFSDYKIKETITYLSGWNSLEDIAEYQRTNSPDIVMARGDLGIINAIDEYDVLIKLPK